MSCNVQFNWGLKIIFVQKFFMKATCFIKFLMLGLYILSTAVPLTFFLILQIYSLRLM